jgi:hypothetical protein
MEFVPVPQKLKDLNNLDVDQIQSLNRVDVVWAEDFPSNPSEFDPQDSGSDLESFVQDSRDSNDYDGIWVTNNNNLMIYVKLKK